MYRTVGSAMRYGGVMLCFVIPGDWAEENVDGRSENRFVKNGERNLNEKSPMADK
jgi:hypothetical protein